MLHLRNIYCDIINIEKYNFKNKTSLIVFHMMMMVDDDNDGDG